MSANQSLTQRERAGVMRHVIESAAVGMDKCALGGELKDGAMAVLQTAAALSIVAGIPIGIAWHAIGNSGKISRNKERDSLNRLDYYRNATQHVENQLARSVYGQE